MKLYRTIQHIIFNHNHIAYTCNILCCATYHSNGSFLDHDDGYCNPRNMERSNYYSFSLLLHCDKLGQHYHNKYDIFLPVL